MSENDAGDSNEEGRNVFIRKEDKEQLIQICEEQDEPLTIAALLRAHLPSIISRIMEGDYDPYELLIGVRKERRRVNRERVRFTPKGEIGWERIEEASDQVNADLDLLYINLESYDEVSIRGWPDMKCTSKEILRATAREIATEKKLISRNMKYRASDLREEL